MQSNFLFQTVLLREKTAQDFVAMQAKLGRIAIPRFDSRCSVYVVRVYSSPKFSVTVR